jgi:hypothetical protein
MTGAAFLWLGLGILVAVALVAALRVVWLVQGAYLIRRAGPRPFLATHHTIWLRPARGIFNIGDSSSRAAWKDWTRP